MATDQKNRKRPRLIKAAVVLFAAIAALISSGCIQQEIFVPVATVTGRITVPPGKDPLGIKVTTAGFPNHWSWVNEQGDYKIEYPRTGRYLLIARGRDFDVDFVWADAYLEKSVKVDTLYLREKVVGEAKWLATRIDYPDAIGFKIKSLDPVWATSTIHLFDDGTHDDRLSDDGIYTSRLSNLPTYSQLYSLIWIGPDGEKEVKDPHAERERINRSEILVKEAGMKVARGMVTSALIGVNYSEVILSTKGGARRINLDSDGSYSLAMEGNAREYLVFRSTNFHIRAIPVDLTTIPIYDVPTITLVPKASGELKVILVKSDFQTVKNPTVVGDFTNWQPQALYDDGTNGDEVAGDGVYTRMFRNLAPGYHKYAINITQGNQVRDPYQESGDSRYSIILVK